ncbi:MAG: hypothetical protein HY400_01185 [Elusimicrobia bacterium]|nr:hypothetical protein [Elusimicrobiota bacterium]
MSSYLLVLDTFADVCGLKFGGTVLSDVWKILFREFRPEWLCQNQKFDFSVSTRSSKGLRMSVNDYGEKEAFEEKLLLLFDLFGNAFDRGAALQVLKAVKSTRDLHQTTLGMDWQQGCAFPRLKIYFEELKHYYPVKARIGLLRRICQSVGLAVPSLPEHEDLAAVCLDFLSGGNLHLKTYAFRSMQDNLEGHDFLSDRFKPSLSLEPHCFFYKTVRHNQGGEVLSVKFYKVYESQQIRDFTLSFEEIYSWLEANAHGATEDEIRDYRTLASDRGCLMYPVLCAVDFARNGESRTDAYFSIR